MKIITTPGTDKKSIAGETRGYPKPKFSETQNQP
jgi:hypothetical protein